MTTMRFSVLLRGHLVDEAELPGDLAGPGRSVDIVELEGGLRISNEQHELVAWQFEDLNFIVAWLVQGLESLFRGTPLDVCSPGQTLRFRSAGETIVVDGGTTRVALPRREFLRELYDLCRRFTDFWTTVAGKWSEQRKALEALPLRHIEAFGGAVRDPTISPVVVDISVCNPGGGDIGAFDFLIGDAMNRVGPLAGLHAVLDGVERLAGGIAKLRDGQVIVSVVLGHNTLWLTQQKVGISQCAGVCYRDVEAGLVERAELDAECGRAVWRFVESLPGAPRRVAEVWPPAGALAGGSRSRASS